MSKLLSSWVRTTIGDIATLINGRAFKTSEWSKIGLPIVRIQNLNKAHAPFNYFSGQVAERHLVHNGDLLFAWSGTPGTSFGAHIWHGPTAVLNQHIFNIRVDPQLVDRSFLRLAINQTLGEQIAKAHGGAGLRHVTKGAFETTEILLPPVEEQRRITARVRVLEERSAITRSHLETVLASVDIGRAAFLRAAYDLTLLPREQQLLYSELPLVSIGDMADDLAYGSSAKSASTGDVPVLRMGNIQRGELDWSDLVYTSDKREIERYLLQPGDVLFNRTNSPQLVGKTSVYCGERPAIFAGYLIRIRCSERMLPKYLAYCLNSPIGREYCRMVKSDGVSQSNINSRKLAAFRLPCPNLSDQQELINRVDVGLKKLASIAIQARIALQNLDVLYRELVRQALSGQLKTFRSLDEPANIQLEGLIVAKRVRSIKRDVEKTIPGGKVMARKVVDILRAADDWVHVQELADQYGIGFGTQTEEVEPFFAELRELDVGGDLLTQPILNSSGTKIGQRIRLKVSG